MPLQLFLNEKSLPSEEIAFALAVSVVHLKQLVLLVREAREIDPELVLNSDVPIANLPLGAGATVASVRNAGGCIEESLYLKTINNRAPLTLAAAEITANGSDPGLVEYRLHPGAPIWPGEAALGLGYAHLFDGLSLSLPTHDYWLEHLIELDLLTLSAAGEIGKTQVTARNAARATAVYYHAEALCALNTPPIADGMELWERRADLFTNLDFIPRTRAQVQAILPGDPMLEQAWKKLRGIDQAIEAWKIGNGPHPMFPFNVRPESRSRIALTEFEDNERNVRRFSQHCDLAPTEARIHFIVETVPRRHAIIGHIGRKLGIG